MSTNPEKPDLTNVPDEVKETFSSHPLSKIEGELYREEDNVKMPFVRVKCITLPHDGARWKVFEDSKVVFVLEGAKLNSKERDFLRTVDGANFLLRRAKTGIKSFNALKKDIKKAVKKAPK
jgi:hypothetical protein